VPLDLASLHAVVPLLAIDPALSARYRRFLRRVRGAVHPRGVSDVRVVQTALGPLSVDLGDDDGCRLFYGPQQDAAVDALFVGLLRPTDVVAVVGAGCGLTVAAIGRLVLRAEGGAVHALEDRPALGDLLRENMQRNGLSSLVQIHDAPVTGADHSDDAGVAGSIAASLRAHGVTRLDALHVAASADVVAALQEADGLLKAAVDPLLRLDLDAERLGEAGLDRLAASVSSLQERGFAAYTADAAGVLSAGWPAALACTDPPMLLLARTGGDRERFLQSRLPLATPEGMREPLQYESPPHEAGPLPLPTAVPLMTALAVSRLRELDAITGLMSAQLGAPPRTGPALTSREVAAAWEQAMQRDDDMFTLQSEIERLLKESDIRLQEARQFRQEAKALRARYEVIAGQRLREAGAAARRFLEGLRSRRGAPKRRR